MAPTSGKTFSAPLVTSLSVISNGSFACTPRDFDLECLLAAAAVFAFLALAAFSLLAPVCGEVGEAGEVRA